MWERELRKIKGLYDNRLRASQQKSSKMEQALTNQTYQVTRFWNFRNENKENEKKRAISYIFIFEAVLFQILFKFQFDVAIISKQFLLYNFNQSRFCGDSHQFLEFGTHFIDFISLKLLHLINYVLKEKIAIQYYFPQSIPEFKSRLKL